jgi:hypothetical protein
MQELPFFLYHGKMDLTIKEDLAANSYKMLREIGF